MIDGLKPYPKMKDSGVPWLGEVPEHWEVRRLKYLLRERDVRSSEGTEQLLRVSQFTGVTERKRADGGDEPDTRAESLVGYKRVEANDLVVNIMLAWNGSMGVSSFPGIASPAYCVYRFGTSAQPWYFHHLLRSPTYKARIKAVSTGVVESRLRLYTDDLYRLEALLPPLPEQAAIVRFLDHADRRIRRYIRAKQKLIKLLEEQKQAIIHRAVTRGLDPNVRLKPSGVEWLGDVPEHWDVRKLKRLARLNPSRSESVKLRDSVDQATFLPMERISCDGEIDASLRLPIRDLWQGYTYFRRGDVLLAKITPCFENGKGACLTSLPTELGFGTTEFIVLRAGTLIRPDFLYQVTRLATFRSIGVESMTGSAGQQRVSQEFVANFQVPLPPLPEQAEIVEGLRMGILRIGSAITRAQSEISFLREYRTRLIADVVSGKLDVREAAARLSQEAEDLEPLEEAATDADGDEALADDANAATEEAET